MRYDCLYAVTGDPRPPDEQVQGIRVCDDDKLRRGARLHPVTERLHAWQQGPPGLLQDQQPEGLDRTSRLQTSSPSTKFLQMSIYLVYIAPMLHGTEL